MNSEVSTARCHDCSIDYVITSLDLKFLEKFDSPEPHICPACREQRRLSFLNMLNLFRRNCDATQSPIVSSYPPDSPYKVYSQAYWYSDAFDALLFGREFDFTRTFFDQYGELMREVPRPPLFTAFLQDENCSYSNHSGFNKNCYMIFDTATSRDTFYSYGLEDSRDSMESYRAVNIELCHEVIDCVGCYNSSFLQNCQNCQDSSFLLGCIGCSHCLMCVNLTHKKFHILNKPVSEEEFHRARALLTSRNGIRDLRATFEKFAISFPRKFMEGMHNENVQGDYLVRCKNTFESYDCRNIDEGMYCTQSFLNSKDSYCTRECGDGELFYESANSGGGYNLRFCLYCYQSVANLTYCDYCVNGAADLFGCFGVKGKKFCILNTQYEESEFRSLVERIVGHMKETGEWGQPRPISLVPFEYNISEAMQRYPLTKEVALKKGYRWREPDQREYRTPTAQVPERLDLVTEDVTKELFACAECAKNFKIISQELKLYRTLQVALPDKCFSCRNRERDQMRNERKLYSCLCSQCGGSLWAAKSKKWSQQPVLCEKCFAESLA